MSITIDKGVPMPSRPSDADTSSAIKQMEIGDSFLYPKRNRSVVLSIAARIGIRLKTRKLDKETVRVWRIA